MRLRDTMVPVTCPECGESRKVRYATAHEEKFTGICRPCGRKLAYGERPKKEIWTRKCLRCDQVFVDECGLFLCPSCRLSNSRIPETDHHQFLHPLR
ncbi:MAG TPA: hypothetical protein DCE18_14610 [Syntrophobacteraceae bacterium]|nr:hypothetical protein [Syntrophobacteraceae bacterium]